MFKALIPDCVPPQWMMLTLIAVLFVWGFSKRVQNEVQAEEIITARKQVKPKWIEL
jgi:hypothetical protein